MNTTRRAITRRQALGTTAAAALGAALARPLAAQTPAAAPLMDVLCAAPYAHTRAELEKLITGYHAMRKAHGKPLLVNECIPGSLSDGKRAAVARCYTELLSAAGFGWMGWALREGQALATRRDRYDGNGINGEGFHPFFTKAGTLWGGLEFLTEKPKLPVPSAKA